MKPYILPLRLESDANTCESKIWTYFSFQALPQKQLSQISRPRLPQKMNTIDGGRNRNKKSESK